MTVMVFLHPGITVGLVETSYNTPEIGGPLSVCAEMFNGNLARNVSLTITSSDGTAIGMTCMQAYIMHNIMVMSLQNCLLKVFNASYRVVRLGGMHWVFNSSLGCVRSLNLNFIITSQAD